MKKITLGLALAAALPITAQAQNYLGIATSNWSGTNGLYLNPANLADNRQKFSIDLFSMHAGIDNNFTSFKLSDVSNFLRSDSKELGDLLTFSQKEKYTLAGPNGEFRGPGFMTSIGRKHAVALTTRARFMTQAHNIDGRLFQSILDSSFTETESVGFKAKADAFNVTAHAWAEIGLSYGGIIWENDKHMLKGGATLRYLAGSQYMSFVNKNLDLQYYSNTDSVEIRNTDISYSTNSDFNDFEIQDLLNFNGSGVGMDLGFVYEFRPKHADYRYDMDGQTGILDNSKNAYTLRVSAAITDLGSISYKKDVTTATFRNATSKPGYIRGEEIINELSNFDSLKNYLTSRGFAADTSHDGKTKVGLPTAMILSVDYHVAKDFYVNAMYRGSVANRGKFGNSVYGQFNVTPRYDTRIFSVGVPITYNMLSSSASAGIGVRVGGFFLGSDKLVSLSGKSYGADFYFGASVPFNKKKPRDSDGDLVSNRKDKCKHEKGIWEMQGCPDPDKDGDGILDKEDKCPDMAGSKTAEGCPDADMDGVADAEDRCPQDAGAVAMKGCPDRDNDGIADIDDTCPDLAGLAQFQGCPDSDKDGLADNKDLCPNAAGSLANNGCPDTDNDGILDNEDKCPAVAGTKNNNGCPEVSVEVKKRLAFAATAIQFDASKATIQKASNKMLDEIVTILNNYPDYYMTIYGHTDNSGNAAKNLQLSKDRADAVKNYFISKGISSDRLEANGFGDTQPAADNKTAAGRAKNRRVAMDLKLRD